MSLQPDAIAVDGGSTDSGPHYLGTGTTKMTRKALQRDLRQLMHARASTHIPLVIGSCGTCGTDSGVDLMADLCAEIATQDGLRARVARVYSELSATQLAPFLARGAIQPLAPLGPLQPDTLARCTHIVGALGAEPLQAALDAGADIVLAGRATDTAVLAAAPLRAGCHAAASWHAAKVAECGGFCTTQTNLGGVLFTVDNDGFEIEPLHEANRCTPYSVAAHLLYENADPHVLIEPGIAVDTRNAIYTALDERRVRVDGTLATTQPYTTKLEGAAPDGYRAMAFTAIADPHVLAGIDAWLAKLERRITRGAHEVLGYNATDFAIDLRAYGHNALAPPGQTQLLGPAREVGVMLVVSARSQDIALEIVRWANPHLLHMPLLADDPVPSFAFPYSPAEVALGPSYAFVLNHVVAHSDPLALVRMQLHDVGPT